MPHGESGLIVSYTKGRIETIIITNNLSVIKAVRSPLNSRWNRINKATNTITAYGNKIKILSIPRGVDILGKERANLAVQSTSLAPLLAGGTNKHVTPNSLDSLKIPGKHTITIIFGHDGLFYTLMLINSIQTLCDRPKPLSRSCKRQVP